MKNKNIISFIFILSAVVIWTPAEASATDLEKKIAEFIQKNEATKDSGVAIAIIRNQKVVFEKGFGYRNRKSQFPVTAHTLFAIGSNTKSFTSAALAILQEAGRIDFSQPIQRYLPDFELSDKSVSHQMTLIDMLSHRSGLPRHDTLWYYTPFTRQQLYSKLKYLELNPRPDMGFRKGFQYNNLMYMTAAIALEKMSGFSWEDFVVQRLLKPLDMNESNLSITQSALSADFAVPYVGDRELTPKVIDSVGPAGAINSNLVDLEKWVNFMLTKGRNPSGQNLLSADSVQLLYPPEIDATKFVAGYPTSYGLGWFVSAIDGKKLIWHGGNIDGYFSKT